MYNSVYLTAGCRPFVTTSKYSSQLWGHARLAESQGFGLWIPAMTNPSMGNSTAPPFSRILRDSPMIFQGFSHEFSKHPTASAISLALQP